MAGRFLRSIDSQSKSRGERKVQRRKLFYRIQCVHFTEFPGSYACNLLKNAKKVSVVVKSATLSSLLDSNVIDQKHVLRLSDAVAVDIFRNAGLGFCLEGPAEIEALMCSISAIRFSDSVGIRYCW